MGETKPKWGARNIVDHRSIDGEIICEIKRLTNFEMDEFATDKLRKACERFLNDRELFSPQNRVRRSAKRAALKKMLFKARNDGPLPSLIKMLKALDPHTRSFLRTETALSDFSDPDSCYQFTIDDLVRNLEILNLSVLEGYEKLQDKKDAGGRSLNLPLRDFLNELYGIYKECTGRTAKRAYEKEIKECYGDFPAFASNCTSALGLKKTYPLKTLHSAIQRYVKETSSPQDKS